MMSYKDVRVLLYLKRQQAKEKEARKENRRQNKKKQGRDSQSEFDYFRNLNLEFPKDHDVGKNKKFLKTFY